MRALLDRLVMALYRLNGGYLTPAQERAALALQADPTDSEAIEALRPFNRMAVGAPGSIRRGEQDDAIQAWQALSADIHR
jgi:hypothetical protein